MLIRQLRHLAPTRSTLDEAFLDKERLVHLLNGTRVFAQRRGNGGKAYGATLELVDDSSQYLVVNLVEPITVDVQCFEGIAGNLRVDAARTLHLRKVAHTTQHSAHRCRSIPSAG